MRINKFLKEKGFTTRRGADELILSGSVLVNGKKAVIGQDITSRDIVEIKGTTKSYTEDAVYIAYNKPIGILTNKDGDIGKDIVSTTEFIKENGKPAKVFPVGRLDKDSHGLIIMTNDGRVTDKLLSPRFKHEKEYIVTLDRPFNDYFIERMQNGVRIDGAITRKCELERVSHNSFKIILTEGKKRQIRRMCEALHYDVVDLQRVRIMNIMIERLRPGEYRFLKEQELKNFLAALYISPIKTLTKSKITLEKKDKLKTLLKPKAVEPKKSPKFQTKKLKGSPKNKKHTEPYVVKTTTPKRTPKTKKAARAQSKIK